MTSVTPVLERARTAFRERRWLDALHGFEEARSTRSLEAADLWRLGVAAYLIGREGEFVRAIQDAHREYADAGEPVAAARSAFWLGFHLATRGEMAPATGWFGRATRLLDGVGLDCAERGYLMLPLGHGQLIAGESAACARTAAAAVEIAERFADADLLALALHLQGRALLRDARVPQGLALLDEAMVGVATGELSPLVTGLVYCSVIGACREVLALRRAHEWTEALTSWCESQPDLVAFAGECRVHRAELLQLQGAWDDALSETHRAAERVEANAPRVTGLALYRRGELHRLRGELEAAEAAYRAASRHGVEPQPGLALLRLAQGDAAAAAAAVRRAVAEETSARRRIRLLPALIEILLESGEIDDARRTCDELVSLAPACAADVHETVVSQARGSIALATGEAADALGLLRRALQGWQSFGARHEAARVRVLLALACRAVGDEDSADLELDAARTEFERLLAAPDLARIESLRARPRRRDDFSLTKRERQVLAEVATGRTNRAIADALSISERTVARHVANIFGKLGVSSRAAATAFAYEHDLVDPSA